MGTVDVRETPNPLARRFVVDHEIQPGQRGRAYRRDGTDDGAPTEGPVADVLAIPGVTSVLTLPSSMTVSVADPAEWDRVVAAVIGVLER